MMRRTNGRFQGNTKRFSYPPTVISSSVIRDPSCWRNQCEFEWFLRKLGVSNGNGLTKATTKHTAWCHLDGQVRFGGNFLFECFCICWVLPHELFFASGFVGAYVRGGLTPLRELEYNFYAQQMMSSQRMQRLKFDCQEDDDDFWSGRPTKKHLYLFE